jgi:hypothetical protein
VAKSWFKNVLDFASQLISSQGEDFILEEVGPQNGVTEPAKQVEKDLDYLTIRVRSSRIVDIRRWTSKFYGSIQSRVSYLHGDRGLVELQRVIVPDKMREIDPANIDRFIQIDKPVIGPVPYIGDLSLELGLFSLKGSDLAAPYLDLLTSLAETSGVAAISAALPYVEPLRKGAELLFGNKAQSTLEIGFDKSWSALRTGTWLAMRAGKGSLNLGDLRIDSADAAITGKDGKAFRNFPYIVFSIEASRRRDDWMTIPELKSAWDAIAKAAKKGDTNDAEQLLRQFSLIARWSPDLVPADADRLVKKGEAQLSLIQPETTVAHLPPKSFPEFADLNLYDER